MRSMSSFPVTKLALAIGLLVAQAPSFAQESTLASAGSGVDEIYIVGVRENRVSKGATGLSLDIKDTPQSISVVGRDLMDAFGTNNLNDALKLATGISVEEWETNRTNYTARGFDIKNTQVDGVGMPNNWGIVTGVMDSAGYEKLEVIRGANGLLTGVGNASGTINYVRKRPTNAAQGNATFSVGSFNSRRAEVDYSAPFTEDAEWAGRVVAVRETGESYLDGLENDHTYIYGVIDGQLTDDSTLTAGYSYQDADTVGNFWGGLVLSNSDKTQAEFDRSVSTSQDWTYWDTNNTNAFVEYTYQLSPDWEAKLTYNFRRTENDDQLFYVSTSGGIDKETGLGLSGWPGKYQDDEDAHLLDGSVTGRFELFGLTQEVIFGASAAKSELLMHNYETNPEEPASGALPPFPFKRNAIPEPVWGQKLLYEDSGQELDRAYGALRLSATSDLTTVVGFNYARYHRDGNSSGNDFDQTEQKFSPYAGITYDFNDHVLGYVSYSDIYQPQDYTGEVGDYLDPAKGVNYEIGIKADWLDKRLLTTLAWFTAEQENLGTQAGYTTGGRYFYEGRDIDSEGVELEITGQIGSLTSVVLGLTKLTLEDQQGADTYEWVPRETANLAINTKLPRYTDVAYGLSAKWQSRTRHFDDTVEMILQQESYATLNLFASWDITERAQLKLNINNVTDEKYLTSMYNVGFYAAPRNIEASLKVNF
ncbi:MAG: TonB-dependent siderophore receptor [Gammaproteobacteria bacterium]|nr:MAG: TonB-dependent siderophore receptor [Gammaproteobacteria bacterium]